MSKSDVSPESYNSQSLVLCLQFNQDEQLLCFRFMKFSCFHGSVGCDVKDEYQMANVAFGMIQGIRSLHEQGVCWLVRVGFGTTVCEHGEWTLYHPFKIRVLEHVQNV